MSIRIAAALIAIIFALPAQAQPMNDEEITQASQAAGLWIVRVSLSVQ
jgi:hypothetical protein